MTTHIHFTEANIGRPAFFGGGNWHITDLNCVTVIMGRNGSGKSQLLRAWRNTDSEAIHYIVPERTGEFTAEAGWTSNEATGASRSQQSQQNFSPDYRKRLLTRVYSYFQQRGAFEEDRPTPVKPSELAELLAVLLPDYPAVLRNEGQPLLLARDGKAPQPVHAQQLSSGEADLVCVALDLLTVAAMWELKGSNKRLVLFDEPDVHVHPDLQARLASFLVNTAERFKLQLVVATHNVSMMAALGQSAKEKCSVLYFDSKAQTQAAKPCTQSMREIAACLGGHVLLGHIFGVPLLLVEGDDDYRIWSQVPRHGIASLAALPCSGEEIKTYQHLLEQTFGALSSAESGIKGYALLDGDKGLPQASQSHPQKHVKFVQLNCHEAENLYLTDEVLQSLDINWETAKAKIVANASHYGAKGHLLQTANAWNRKQHDLKPIINELSQILDSKGIHWTHRVGVCIGRSKPVGQLADFLGAPVVAALWNA